MPKAFSTKEKEIIRQTLLDAGRKQFSQFGLRKTNVAELARAARTPFADGCRLRLAAVITPYPATLVGIKRLCM